MVHECLEPIFAQDVYYFTSIRARSVRTLESCHGMETAKNFAKPVKVDLF